MEVQFLSLVVRALGGLLRNCCVIQGHEDLRPSFPLSVKSLVLALRSVILNANFWS